MTTKEVAKKLTQLCKEDKNIEAVETLYSPNIVSIEAMGDEKMPARMEGVSAVLEKNNWWMNLHDVQDQKIQGPFFNGDDQFSIYTSFLMINKESGDKTPMEEVCLYTVKDGKIVEERFFYNTEC
jgi:hypothetical protein